MVEDFHAYERELGRRFLIPLLGKQGFSPAGKSVLDVGCGYGGVLAALAESFDLAGALGVDLDAEMVAAGRAKCPPGVGLETADFFSLEAAGAGRDGKGYDLILLRDVLEHIVDVEGALRKAAGLLRPGGLIFASFAPFLSPFGGHQHNGSGFFAGMPWIHLLPEKAFRSLLGISGNSYKSSQALDADMESVARTRLTLGRFRRAVRGSGLRCQYYAGYLSRPDYRIKFGLPQVRFPRVPLAEEFLCTGAEALLRQRDGR